jgi:hypothetical protein
MSSAIDENRQWNSLILNFCDSNQRFFSQFCDVVEMAIISNDLVKFDHMYQYGSRKKSKSFYMFGYLLELIIKNIMIGQKKFEIWLIFGPLFS